MVNSRKKIAFLVDVCTVDVLELMKSLSSAPNYQCVFYMPRFHCSIARSYNLDGYGSNFYIRPSDLSLNDLRSQLKSDGPFDEIIGNSEETLSLAHRMRSLIGLPYLPENVLDRFRRKATIKRFAASLNIPTVEWRCFSPEKWKTDLSDFRYPLVIKTDLGCRSQGTFVANSEGDMKRIMKRPELKGHKFLLGEKKIIGDEFSLDGFVIGGRVVWFSSCAYLQMPLIAAESRLLAWQIVLPRARLVSSLQGPIRMVQKYVSESGLINGFVHSEFFFHGGIWMLSEIAARTPAASIMRLLSVAHQFDFYLAWLETLVDSKRPKIPKRVFASGAVHPKAPDSGFIKSVRGVKCVKRVLGNDLVSFTIPKKGLRASRRDYEGDSVFIIKGSTTRSVKESLDFCARTIRIDIAR